jgi:hypothetical protein
MKEKSVNGREVLKTLCRGQTKTYPKVPPPKVFENPCPQATAKNTANVLMSCIEQNRGKDTKIG